MEKTVIIIKPDGVHKGADNEIIGRIKNNGLNIVNTKITKLTRFQILRLYQESLRKFPQIKKEMINYMTEDISIVIIVEGNNAIQKVRAIRGLSDPSKSPVGSIRRDFAGDQNMEELTKAGLATKNIMHASGSMEEVELEIKLFFKNEN